MFADLKCMTAAVISGKMPFLYIQTFARKWRSEAAVTLLPTASMATLKGPILPSDCT